MHYPIYIGKQIKEVKADLASAKYLGAFDMLSMPPARTISLMPS